MGLRINFTNRFKSIHVKIYFEFSIIISINKSSTFTDSNLNKMNLNSQWVLRKIRIPLSSELKLKLNILNNLLWILY